MINVKHGQWGLSRIVGNATDGYSCAALENNPDIEAHYPPFDVVTRTYTHQFCLVFSQGTITNTIDTVLIPRRIDANNYTLGDLNNPQRSTIRNFCAANLTAYSWIDWDGSTVNVPAFDFDSLPLTTTLMAFIQAIYAYFGHSDYRPKPNPVESHNTEYLDDFSTDPSSRWTVELGGTPTWDSGNNELDFDGPGYAEHYYRYSANNPGSIEQEAQVSFKRSTNSTQRLMSAAVRGDSGGTDDVYCIYMQGDDALLARYNAGTRTVITTFTSALSWSSADFNSVRLSASGTAGSNVVLDAWYTSHGTTKPSDPGWIGSDGTPDDTYTDTAANRLDDSTHISCGIAGRNTGGADFDTRHCFFKERAISDRSGGGGSSKVAYTSLTGAGQL